MRDVMRQPHGATVGIMGWPYPGHAWTLWRSYVLSEGLAPILALDGHIRANEEAWQALYADVRAAVLAQLRETHPITARWADSVDWLQERGRGDVVAVMSLHTGAVLSHHCLGWRDDFRDASGALFNWEWVVAMPNPIRPDNIATWHADASGCLLDKRGEPTSKVLVRPTLCRDEVDGMLANWQSTMGEALREVPPVRTTLVEHEPFDRDDYDSRMASLLKAAVGGDVDALRER